MHIAEVTFGNTLETHITAAMAIPATQPAPATAAPAMAAPTYHNAEHIQ